MSVITNSLHRFYRTMQRRHPGVLYYGDASLREIALTFDDGPHPRDTPQVLDVLARHNIHATFFLVGQSVERYPHLVKQIYQAGHQLALHCYRHLPFPLENPVTLHEHLERTRKIIAGVCDITPETLHNIRPPYGIFTTKTMSLLTKWNFRLVMWSSIPPHWMQPVDRTIKQVFNEVVPGSVIVLHDGHGHGRKVASIVDTVVPRLKEMGFDFSKVENMKRDKLHGQ
jgi:peptidoglycan/xylan/chitin deacetylase (PgdA/CDA1 family)